MTCERASEKAREALRKVEVDDVEPVQNVLEWIGGVYKASAGDFCEVLEVLDGEIAVEVVDAPRVYLLFGAAGYRLVNVRGRRKNVSRKMAVSWLEKRLDGGVRLLHKDDPELPGAVRQAMEADR